MINLLKANFYKLLRDKATFIMIGLSAATALVLIVLYAIMGNFTADFVSISGTVNGKNLFLSGATLGSNIGIMIAVAVALFMGKEFSQNTVRNKIIVGFSKTKIYLSNLIMSIVICIAMFLSYQIVVFAIGLPMFGWGSKFVVGEFIRQLINALLIIITFSAVLNMISMLTRSLVAGMLTSIFGLVILFAIIGGFVDIPFTGIAKDIVNIIIKTNFLGQSILIATENSVAFMVWVITSSIVITAGSALLGSYLFEKTDVK